MHGVKAKLLRAANSMAWLYGLAALGTVLTIIFVIAFVTGRNLIDFVAAAMLVVLTASYIREIVQRKKRL